MSFLINVFLFILAWCLICFALVGCLLIGAITADKHEDEEGAALPLFAGVSLLTLASIASWIYLGYRLAQ